MSSQVDRTAEALDKLASLDPGNRGWRLMAETDPAIFLSEVANELARLQKALEMYAEIGYWRRVGQGQQFAGYWAPSPEISDSLDPKPWSVAQRALAGPPAEKEEGASDASKG